MILIIAYGNTLRGDDGAGLLLGERLEYAWRARHVPVARLAVHQLAPELAVELAQETVQAVVFVDTALVKPDDRDPAVQVYPLTAHTLAPNLGHQLDPSTLLIYADQLYGRRPPAWQVTIPGLAFEHGETLSPITQQALVTAPIVLADWLDQLATTGLTAAL